MDSSSKSSTARRSTTGAIPDARIRLLDGQWAAHTPAAPRRTISAGFGFADVQTQLYILAGLTVLIFALESAFQYAYQVLWRNLAQKLQHDLRLDAYGHLQYLDMAWFEDSATGNLVAILNDDVNQLERFLDGSLVRR